MDPSLEAALRILDEIRQEAVETGPVVLSEAYLRAVARVEGLPQNRSGADKTWVFTLLRQSGEMLARAVRVR